MALPANAGETPEGEPMTKGDNLRERMIKLCDGQLEPGEKCLESGGRTLRKWISSCLCSAVNTCSIAPNPWQHLQF